MKLTQSKFAKEVTYKSKAMGNFIKVEVIYFTGNDNQKTQIPDIEITVYILGMRVFKHKFIF